MSKKVLLIDDAKMMRNLLKRVLEPNGYVCVEAANGNIGVEMYRKHHPDIVLCDISMPGMDGMQCMHRILEVDKNAKVIMCTSQGKECFIDEAIEAGAKSYIAKPIHAKNALGVVSRVLDGGSVNYKEMMMENGERIGLNQKELLDFFDNFRAMTGKDMEDMSVDRDYLLEQKASIAIGMEAFLASKLALDRIHMLVDVFIGLCG